MRDSIMNTYTYIDTGQPDRGQRGITGLETAIILIAFVVVASVFAFTILSSGVFAAERSKQSIRAGLQDTRSTLLPKGGTRAFRGFDAANAPVIFKISFTVANAVGGEPVDLTPPSRPIRPVPPPTRFRELITSLGLRTRMRASIFQTGRGQLILLAPTTATTSWKLVRRPRSRFGCWTWTPPWR